MKRNKIILKCILLTFSLYLFSFPVNAEELTEPVIPTEQTEENINSYNQQVDEYNKEIDNIYNQELEEYNANLEYNKQEEDRVNQLNTQKEEEVTQHNEEEDLKVEENQKQLEEQEKLEQQIQAFEEKGITDNRVTNIEDVPTTYDTTTDNPITIQIQEAEEKAGEKYNVINLHLYFDGEQNEYIGTDIKDANPDTGAKESFHINEDMLKDLVLLEYESVEVDKNDIITVISESEAMGYRSAAFYRKMEGYTNGYWMPSSHEFASTAVYSYPSWYKGSAQEFSYIDGTTDNKSIKNVFSLFTYVFRRTGQEPEKVEQYNPDYWEVEYETPNFREVKEPVKGKYLEKLIYVKQEEEEKKEEEVIPEEVEEPREPVQDPQEVIPAIEIAEEEVEEVPEPITPPTAPPHSYTSIPNSQSTFTPVSTSTSTEPEITVQPAIHVTPSTIEPVEVSTITDPIVPLDNPEAPTSYWALLNLILTILVVLETLLLFILYFIKNKKEKETEENTTTIKQKSFFKRIISLIISIITIIIFILTEDMTLPMHFIDQYTLLMVIIALIQTILSIIWIRKKNEEE